MDLSLYLVTDRSFLCGRNFADVVRQAVEGGVTVVQLREKNCSTREFFALAKELKTLLTPYQVPLIINDRIDIALAVDADGVHIGQSDMPYVIARKLLGKDKIIGLSVENFNQAEEANALDVDYIAVSPVFDTNTKTDTSTAMGIEGVRKIRQLSRHRIVGIGGMNEKTIPSVTKAGAEGVAVVSAIMSAENPCLAAQNLKKLI